MNESVTTKSTKMLSEDDKVQDAAAESDRNLSASELINLASLQPLPESGKMNFSASWLDDLAPLQPKLFWLTMMPKSPLLESFKS